ncbi:MAG: hypothetical protein ABIR19_08540 [Ginsengibacter sp.]
MFRLATFLFLSALSGSLAAQKFYTMPEDKATTSMSSFENPNGVDGNGGKFNTLPGLPSINIHTKGFIKKNSIYVF